MRKKLLFGSLVIIVAFLIAFNVNLNMNSQRRSLPFSLENVEALAYELPDVDITCGASQGPCWIEDKKLVGPFLPWYVTYCPKFSGLLIHYCTPGLPA